jgi:hypothetical protein
MDSLPIWGKFLGGTGPFRAAVPLLDGISVLACDGFSIWRWNLDDGHVENVSFEGHSEHLANLQSASISPHGTLVATAGTDRTVMIWQADTGKVLCGPLEGHSDDICALSFSTDGKMVVSGSEDRKVWVWSAETGQRVCGPMEGHTGSVRGVCFRCVLYSVSPKTEPNAIQPAPTESRLQAVLSFLHFLKTFLIHVLQGQPITQQLSGQLKAGKRTLAP